MWGDAANKIESNEQEQLTPGVSSEEDLTILDSKVKTTKLKEDLTKAKDPTDYKESVEYTTNKDSVYELMKDSTMYNDLIALPKTDAEIKEFAEGIYEVVGKYLDQELKWFSDNIKKSMNVGIQFAMMESLVAQGADGAATFFESFSSVKSKDITKAFQWLYSAFGKVWDINHFFVLANKVQNITWFLEDNKSSIMRENNVPELTNPVAFKTLLTTGDTRSNKTTMAALKVGDVLTLGSKTAVNYDENNDKLKAIVSPTDAASKAKLDWAITLKSINAIQKALKSADKLLDKRLTYKTKAVDLVDKIAWFLKIDIPFLGNLWDLVWAEFPTDLIASDDGGKWGIANFVLWVLWFHGGVSGLHKRYIQEKLDDLDIDDTYITAAYKAYAKDASTTVTNDSTTGTRTTCALDTLALDATTKATVEAKIPADYTTLKKSIVDNLDTSKLNADVVANCYPTAVTVTDGKNILDVTKITDKSALVDAYLKYFIPKMADTKKKFINSDKVDVNAFTLAVIGGLTGDVYYVEWVRLGLFTAIDATAKDVTTSTTTPTYENIEETDAELVRLATWPNEDYSKNATFVKYLHSLEGTNSLPYGVILNLMIQESSGYLYNTDGVTPLGSSAGAEWLFQFMPATAKTYITKIKKDATTYYTAADYKLIFTNPIVWAKACALFLSERQTAGDDAVNMLAHYNAWPAVLSSAKITSKNFSSLPRETQSYVTRIWYAMLTADGKATVITSAQKDDPTLISDASLKQFITAVNAIPTTSKKSLETWSLDKSLELSSEKILLTATKATQFGWSGDSVMYGFQGKSGLINIKDGAWSTNTKDNLDLRFSTTDKVKAYHVANPDIKSYVMYYGTNSIKIDAGVQTLKDLEEKAGWFVDNGIQPVLSTLVYDTKDTKQSTYRGTDIKSFNDKVIALGAKLKIPVLRFDKIEDLTFQKVEAYHHPDGPGYKKMADYILAYNSENATT